MDIPVYTITHTLEPERIDRLLTSHFPALSRNYFQEMIRNGHVQVNASIINKSSTIVKLNDVIELTFPQSRAMGALPLPETDMGIRLLYEHADFLIIYKPAGVLVHAPHNTSTVVTLADWLVHTFKELASVGHSDRPGIVHRLDKDTSGIMVIPRTPAALTEFARMFERRKMKKTYMAIVEGTPPAEGCIDWSITRHPRDKHKMTHTTAYGREALSHYRVLQQFSDKALLEVRPVTGRTHQIRVHCSAIGHPIVGDSTYGSSSELIGRQALHAFKLSFTYKDKDYVFWHDMPEDMKRLIK